MAKGKISPDQKEQLIRFGMIAGLILVVLAIVGTTLAIFFHEQEQETNINFGVVQLDGSNSYFMNLELEKIIPGGKMTEGIYLSATSISAPLYVRVKVAFEIPSYESIRLENELAILNASNFNESTERESPYMWSDKQPDGYYYLIKYHADEDVNKNELDLYQLSSSGAFFTQGLYLPHSFEQETDEFGNVLSYGAHIVISLCVEAIQAENVPEDRQRIEDVKKYFDVKRLPFSFSYGLYEDNSELINYFGYSVGSPLPVIKKADKRLVWFDEETCSGTPLPDSTLIEENGTYYGAWFFTGGNDDTIDELAKVYDISYDDGKTYAIINAYNGYEANVIVPSQIKAFKKDAAAGRPNDVYLPVRVIKTLSGANNNSLKRVIISEGVWTVTGGAFANAHQLSSVIFPSTLTTLGANGQDISIFNETKCDVTRLVIPSSVNTIGKNALRAISLSRVTFKPGATNVDLGATAFITGSDGNPYLDIIVTNTAVYKKGNWSSFPIYTESSTPYKKYYYGGAYYIKVQKSAGVYVALPVEFNRVLTDFIIPPYATVNGEKLKVESIPNFVAYGYQKVDEIIISEGIKTIGISSFAYCSNLLDIDLPNTLTDIGAKAFDNCVNLFDITMSRSLETIGQYAFRKVNSSLKKNARLKPVGNEDRITCYKVNSGVYSANGTKLEKNTIVYLTNGYTESEEYTKITYTNSSGESVETYVKTVNIDSKQNFSLPRTVTTIGTSAFDGFYFNVVVFKFKLSAGIGSDLFINASANIKAIYVPVGQKSAYETKFSNYPTIQILEGIPS